MLCQVDISLSFSKQRSRHFAAAGRLKFSQDDFHTDSKSMKFAYQTESQPKNMWTVRKRQKHEQ